MDFINSAVDLGSLPVAENINLQPVQPVYKKILLIEWMITSVVLVAISALLLFFIPAMQNSYRWMMPVAAVLLILFLYYLSIQKSFPFLAFAVRDKDVLFQKGWINRSIKITPFNRIQNCSVQTGPLERQYRLASLIIYTAGSEGADMRIPGLLQEEADKLRYFILEKIHKEPNEAV
jgi:membrane protein YdbS with pleckstrin-like domain